MSIARMLFSHILNYSFVYSISHLLYGSFQLYYGWIWNVLHRLLSLISSPALLSRKMEGPWMKWVTGNEPWYWTAQPCFLSSLCLQRRWKQAAVTWSHYHRAHCSSFPLPSEHKSKQTPLLPWVASCQVFGLIDEKSNKNELLLVSMCFSLPQTLHHILLSVLWTASVSKGIWSPLRSPFCLTPLLSHYPHPKLIHFLVRIILCSSWTTLHCFSNCRLRHETNAAHYNQNYICNGNKENSPENVREHHT